MKRILIILGLFIIQFSASFLEDAIIVALVFTLNFFLAFVLILLIHIILSTTTTWLCENSGLSEKFDKWLIEKRKNLSDKINQALEIGFFVASLKVAILLGVVSSAILIYFIGIKKKKAYYLNILFSFVSSLIWCLIYSGGIDIVKKILKSVY